MFRTDQPSVWKYGRLGCLCQCFNGGFSHFCISVAWIARGVELEALVSIGRPSSLALCARFQTFVTFRGALRDFIQGVFLALTSQNLLSWSDLGPENPER